MAWQQPPVPTLDYADDLTYCMGPSMMVPMFRPSQELRVEMNELRSENDNLRKQVQQLEQEKSQLEQNNMELKMERDKFQDEVQIQKPRVFILTGLNPSTDQHIRKIEDDIGGLGGFVIATSGRPETFGIDRATHLYLHNDEVTPRALAAMLAGIPVVGAVYLKECIQHGAWLDTADYQVLVNRPRPTSETLIFFEACKLELVKKMQPVLALGNYRCAEKRDERNLNPRHIFKTLREFANYLKSGPAAR